MAKGRSAFIDLIKNIFKRYFIDATGAMAIGLLVSLTIGTIISQIFKLPLLEGYDILTGVAGYVTSATGAAIGVAIAWGLKAAPIVIVSSAASGMIGYALGGPIGAYISAVAGAEIGNLVAGRTSMDIILAPLLTVVSGGAVGVFAGPYLNMLTEGLGEVINSLSELHPIPMGITLAVIAGLTMTVPLSSAAICIAVGLDGIAAGAACIGCCCHMIGFAVTSYRDNGIAGLISQGLGTSMLQLPNVLRRPQILLAPTLASAILGPISAAVIGMVNTPSGAGMGTSALVGQIKAFEAMTTKGITPLMSVCIILIMHVAAPAALTLAFDTAFRRLGWIKKGDLKIKKL